MGDVVRVREYHSIFSKGNSILYSKDVYVIRKIEKNSIYLKNSVTGKELSRKFKSYEIVPAGSIEYLKKPKEEDLKEKKVHNKG